MKNKSFHTANPNNHEGNSNTWFTPRDITEKLGDFWIDPCTMSNAPHHHAFYNICFDRGDDGLEVNWLHRVWLNPPYGKEIVIWLDKLLEHGNGMALVFSRTETRWAQKHMKACDGFNLLKGRISFLDSNGEKRSTAANGSMLLAYGKNNIESLYNLDGNVFIN